MPRSSCSPARGPAHESSGGRSRETPPHRYRASCSFCSPGSARNRVRTLRVSGPPARQRPSPRGRGNARRRPPADGLERVLARPPHQLPLPVVRLRRFRRRLREASRRDRAHAAPEATRCRLQDARGRQRVELLRHRRCAVGGNAGRARARAAAHERGGARSVRRPVRRFASERLQRHLDRQSEPLPLPVVRL
jgi:hypothetical protein